MSGHPGALLSGWAEGASACVRLPGERPGEGGLAGLIGPELVAAAADLAVRVWQLLGDDVIEWAAGDGKVWLLQSRCSGGTAECPAAGRSAAERATAERVTAGPVPAAGT